MATAKDIKHIESKTFNIRQRHIDAGKPQCQTACAGVLAVEEQFDATRVRIHNGWIAFTVGAWRYEFKTPQRLVAWLTKYDTVVKGKAVGKALSKPTRIRLHDGTARAARRTGGAKDKTEHWRHHPGGRMSRIGFKGHKKVVVTKRRQAGSAVYIIKDIGEE